MTHNQEEKRPVETDPEVTQMVELVEKVLNGY